MLCKRPVSLWEFTYAYIWDIGHCVLLCRFTSPLSCSFTVWVKRAPPINISPIPPLNNGLFASVTSCSALPAACLAPCLADWPFSEHQNQGAWGTGPHSSLDQCSGPGWRGRWGYIVARGSCPLSGRGNPLKESCCSCCFLEGYGPNSAERGGERYREPELLSNDWK